MPQSEPRTIPLLWRSKPPEPQSAGTLYQFVREHLLARGGQSSREDLREAIASDEAATARLARTQGFNRLLVNMRHSGWIRVEQDTIIATPKTFRKARGRGGGSRQ